MFQIVFKNVLDQVLQRECLEFVQFVVWWFGARGSLVVAKDR